MFLTLFLVNADSSSKGLKLTIASLRELQLKEVKNKQKLSEELLNSLKEMSNAKAQKGKEDSLQVQLDRNENEIQNKFPPFRENQLKIEFLSQMVSQLERKTGEPKLAAPEVLMSMAQSAITSAIEQGREVGVTWKFYLYLSVAIKEIFEPSENLGDFIGDYISYSSLSDPKPPQGFLKSRDYIGN